MKLATIAIERPSSPSEAKDGRLVVVSSDQELGATVPNYPTLLSALDDWKKAEPVLRQISKNISPGASTISLKEARFLAPLPRSYGWLDGSAFIQHVILVRKARNAEPPADLMTVPLMYQGASDHLLGPYDDIEFLDPSFGLDLEGEVAVVVDEVPLGVSPKEAESHIKLLLLMNDISLRELIPREVGTGFGFIQSKPSSAFAPFAVTPDELGPAWRDSRVHLNLECKINGQWLGSPSGSEMHFSFGELLAHAARTRNLSAGTILGSGTFSNESEAAGVSCLAEKRMREKIKSGSITTPFLAPNDLVEIEMFKDSKSIFGPIRQRVHKK